MRKQIIVGNWKMFKTNAEGIEFIKNVEASIKANPNLIAGVAAPTIMLSDLTKVAKTVKIAAQNCYFENEGAFTGETSIPMLKSVGVDFVVIGHSERRNIFGESDQMINSKVKSLLSAGLTPILCCGESLEVYEAKKTMQHVQEQLTKDLAGVSTQDMTKVVIAYEPIWAIGTGKVATPEIAQEICHGIRAHIASLFNQEVADQVLIQYGGSVKPENIQEILSQADIDGALVGGASLVEASYLGLLQ